MEEITDRYPGAMAFEKSVQEKVMLWKAYRVAGGTDPIPKLKERETCVECLVDTSCIEDLSEMEGEGNWDQCPLPCDWS